MSQGFLVFTLLLLTRQVTVNYINEGMQVPFSHTHLAALSVHGAELSVQSSHCQVIFSVTWML